MDTRWRLVPIGIALTVLVGGLALALRERAEPPVPDVTEPEESVDTDVPEPGESEAGPPIVDWLLPYGEERTRLTVAYLRFHVGQDALTGDDRADTTMVPRAIVLHWTAGPTAKSAWHEFESERVRRRDVDPEMAVNTSAHFLVDRDGTIFRLVPEERVARHAIGLNHVAIGVENVGGLPRWPLTDAQVAANIALVRDLARRYPITHLVGHFETRLMRDHPLYRELDPDYRSRKLDPGPDFMERVRAGVADLGLLGPP